MAQKQKKVVILDTSVFVHDPDCLEKFADNIVVIPWWVIEEIDRLKRSDGERGEHSRRAARNIQAYVQKGFLADGMQSPGGGKIICDGISDTHVRLPKDMEPSADNKIIFLALKWQKRSEKIPVILVSKDINLRTKANAMRVVAEDYRGVGSASKVEARIAEIAVDSREAIGALHQQGWVDAGDLAHAMPASGCYANQCCYLIHEGKSSLAIYKKIEEIFVLVKKPTKTDKGGARGIRPVNCDQAFANALLMDPRIELVALMGDAGSGKTLMALWAGHAQLKKDVQEESDEMAGESSGYGQILVYRPNIELGRPLGYLPGSLEEKFAPWVYPIFDNMNLILQGGTGGKARTGKRNAGVTAEHLIRQGLLDISPISFVRGRSLHGKFIIIDEAQNLTPHEIKTLITRSGKGSKIVLTGDIGQIDHPYVDSHSNGLAYAVSRFLGQEIFGLTIMNRGEERSQLAKLGAQLL